MSWINNLVCKKKIISSTLMARVMALTLMVNLLNIVQHRHRHDNAIEYTIAYIVISKPSHDSDDKAVTTTTPIAF